MTENDIIESLEKSKFEFFDTKWKGMIPNNFVESVKSIFQFLAPNQVGISFRVALKTLSLKDDEITISNVRNLVTWFASVPMHLAIGTPYFQNEEMYNEFALMVDDTSIEWNLLSKKFEESQQRKAMALQKMLPQPSKKRILELNT